MSFFKGTSTNSALYKTTSPPALRKRLLLRSSRTRLLFPPACGVECVMPLRKKSRATKSAPTTRSLFANVNSVRLHYLVAGKGDPVVLLHGYAETSHMWRPLMAELATTHSAMAPDLRGDGQSSTPTDGYTKSEIAQDIHALSRQLRYEDLQILVHDIGVVYAYAYAAHCPRAP